MARSFIKALVDDDDGDVPITKRRGPPTANLAELASQLVRNVVCVIYDDYGTFVRAEPRNESRQDWRRTETAVVAHRYGQNPPIMVVPSSRLRDAKKQAHYKANQQRFLHDFEAQTSRKTPLTHSARERLLGHPSWARGLCDQRRVTLIPLEVLERMSAERVDSQEWIREIQAALGMD